MMLYLTDAAPDLVAPRPERDGDPLTAVVDLANQAAARMERAEAALKEMTAQRDELVVAIERSLAFTGYGDGSGATDSERVLTQALTKVRP